MLAAFSLAMGRRQQVSITYQRGDEHSERAVDPYGLVIHDRVWYLIGYCHLREGVRVFRLDRISAAHPLDAAFTPPADFDALEYLMRSIATMPDRWMVEVMLHTTLDEALPKIPRGMGTLEPHADGVLFRTGGQDIDWLARFLVNLGFPLTIRQPPELRAAFERLAATILATARR
jgi:predicted DNA-binding transcriptional regulator YafY